MNIITKKRWNGNANNNDKSDREVTNIAINFTSNENKNIMELIHYYIGKHKMVTILFECTHVVLEMILGWEIILKNF